jgi:hypothetical protein
MSKLWGVIAGVVAIALAGPAGAHHTFAMFDLGKVVTLTGTLKDFQWTNPHVWIELVVPNADGTTTSWAIEGGSPNALVRKGWKYGVLKPGQKVTVTIHPLKSGVNGGSLLTMTPEGGKTMEDAVSDGKV